MKKDKKIEPRRLSAAEIKAYKRLAQHIDATEQEGIKALGRKLLGVPPKGGDSPAGKGV